MRTIDRPLFYARDRQVNNRPHTESEILAIRPLVPKMLLANSEKV
jgi:hypothetical protein